MKGWCPCCDSLQPIGATGERIGDNPLMSASWKKLADHSDERETRVMGGMSIETRCAGSGKKI